MKGPAGKWILPAIEASTYNTWKELTDALKKAFGESDTREAAQMRIKALRQSSTVNDYWTKFQTDMDLLGWNEAAFKDEYYEGLNPKIRDRLANITNKPKQLRAFVTLCIDLDNELNVNRGRQTKYDLYAPATRSQTSHPPRAHTQYWAAPRNHNGTDAFADASAPTPELPLGDPMDLDASRKPKFMRITDAERARR